MTLARRYFLTGLVGLVAAPAIVRVASIMPVRAMVEPHITGAIMTSEDVFWIRSDGTLMVYRLFTPHPENLAFNRIAETA